jgi:hypothetical protein
MQLIVIFLCAFNIIMPLVAAAIIAPKLEENSPWRLGIFGGFVCALTSAVLYFNIGMVGYPDYPINVMNLIVVFILAFLAGFAVGFATMRIFNDRHMTST